MSDQPVGSLLTDFDDSLQDLLDNSVGVLDRHAFEDWVRCNLLLECLRAIYEGALELRLNHVAGVEDNILQRRLSDLIPHRWPAGSNIWESSENVEHRAWDHFFGQLGVVQISKLFIC